jgi:hypothetical protein
MQMCKTTTKAHIIREKIRELSNNDPAVSDLDLPIRSQNTTSELKPPYLSVWSQIIFVVVVVYFAQFGSCFL